MHEKPPLVIVGGSGHAKVVIELIRAEGRFHPAAVVDRDTTLRSVLDVPVVGDDTALERLHGEGLKHAIIAIGSNETRLRRGRELEELGFRIVNAVSPAATLGSTVRLGLGVAIMAGVIVNSDATVGDYVIINTRASVDHDCQIEEGVHIAPGATLAGNVTVRRLALIGVGANVIPKITIGEGVVVGAGACVVRNLPAGSRALGVPARWT